MKMKLPLKLRGSLLRYKLSQKKVLDVGCGYGEALNNFGESSVGIELDNKRRKIAKKTGRKILAINIEEKNLKGDFDAIWISHVLEHMTSPLLVLNRFNKILKNRCGLLFVTVPVISKNPLHFLYEKMTGIKGWDANMHSYAFTDKSLEFLLKNAGFRVIEKGYLIFKSKFLNLLVSPFLSLTLGQKTFVAVKDDSLPKPRISPPKPYKIEIRHKTDYISEEKE